MSIVKSKWQPTLIQFLGTEHDCDLFVKREDFIPFSFGGNKARKAELFFAQIQKQDADCVVTYGSGSSNHCRVIANMAASLGLSCFIISPLESSECTYNSVLMELFNAHIETVPVKDVHETIEMRLRKLRSDGRKPYFIPGGGHGNIGTQAFVECYEEIKTYEAATGINFDYIFHASGTGTTQAGLICGQLLHKDTRRILGISIARKCPRGRDIVLQSVRDYLGKETSVSENSIQDATFFIDDYTGNGYGIASSKIDNCIDYILKKYGLPLDATYTGKAFTGMLDYLERNAIKAKKVLFIHTGGTPLFFDHLRKITQQ